MNAFQYLISQAIARGVSEETIILLILLPLVASVVAATRHLLGFRGFGILIPTAIAVTFIVIGVGTGLFLFMVILVVATLARQLLRKLRLHYLPRMALLLWSVTIIVLALIVAAPFFEFKPLTTISIFPIVILILLFEEFIGVQISKSFREAAKLTVETMIVALFGYLILTSRVLEKWALLYPHWLILAPVIFDLLLGRFAGLRLLEYRRFKRLLK